MLIQTDKRQLTPTDITAILRAHDNDYYKKAELRRYYNGNHAILGKVGRENTNVNNKLVANYCAYIVNMSTGYFIGKPVAYSAVAAKTAEVDALMGIFRYNDESAHNLELAEDASITGEAFELIYIDSDAEIRLGTIPSEEMILVTDATIEASVLYAIRRYKVYDVGQITYSEYVDVYDDTTITHYSYDTTLRRLGTEEHYIGDVPVVLYANNKQRRGDFEDVISLVDAYNKAQSLTLDDLEDFTDAFLVLKNMGGTDRKNIAKLRQSKVLLVEDNGGAEWLIKNVNDTYVENVKTRLQRDIHKFSAIPDVTDESFISNASGVAIKYRLVGLEQIRGRKEREFKKSLQRRIEIISGILKLKSKTPIDFRDIKITFTANLPANLEEQAKIVTSLDGMVSHKTLLSLLPFVENPQEELDEMAKEESDPLDDYPHEH